jgi:hypothetical protein
VGKVQTKAEFVDGAAKLHWKSIVASDETASIVGNIRAHASPSRAIWRADDLVEAGRPKKAFGWRPPELASLMHSAIFALWNRFCGRPR